MKKHVVLDASLGRDSYFSAMAAIQSELIHVDAITIGDFKMDRTVHGMLHLLQHMYVDIPVCKGAAGGLGHQNNGETDPFSGKWPADEYCKIPAKEKMAEIISGNSDKTIILTHSTLTNVAELLIDYPELKGKIDFIVVLENRAADCIKRGFDFDPPIDPESANAIFESGVKVYFVPLETMSATEKNQQVINRICKSTDNIIGRFLHHASIKEATIPVLCGCADVVIAACPDGFICEPVRARAVTEGDARGQFEISEFDENSNVYVVTSIDYSRCLIPGFGVMDTPALVEWNRKNEGSHPHHHD